MNIRRANKKDIEIIGDLWEEMMILHGKRHDYFEIRKDAKDRYIKYLNICIKKRKNLIIVAEIEDKVVGYLMAERYLYPPVYIKEEYVEILELSVNSDFRKNGIGSLLVEEAKKWAKKHNIEFLECRYSVSNELSTSFWENKSFEPVLKIGYIKV